MNNIAVWFMGFTCGLAVGISVMGVVSADDGSALWDRPYPQIQQPYSETYGEKWLDREVFRNRQVLPNPC